MPIKQLVDVLVIGGGATGCGVALDAQTRGFDTVLLEAGDFGQATSSRSTKLIHGGVRYLRQGNVGLVREALHERGRLMRNAPDVVKRLPLVIPVYKPLASLWFGTGMWMYDRLAGKEGIGQSRRLSVEETCERLPGIRREGLKGGVLLHDGQFDDTRLLLSVLRSFRAHGGQAINYCRVTNLLRDGERIAGAEAEHLLTGETVEVRAKHVVNTAGIFSDELRRMAHPHAAKRIRHSRGSHLVLPRSALPGETALLIPETRDGRLLFMIPWLGATLLGTTDIAVEAPELHPEVSAEETTYLLEHARALMNLPEDVRVLSRFAGLRPLVSQGEDGETAQLSRKHVVEATAPGFISVMGGKWTTFRKMAEDAVDAIAGGRPCKTRDLPLETAPAYPPPLLEWQVRHAVEEDGAQRLEDVLARRSRWLLLDAAACCAAAPQVAEWMATALGKDEDWQHAELEAFDAIAKAYLTSSQSP